MVFKDTFLTLNDNTGVLLVKCLIVLNRQRANIGDFLIVTIKKKLKKEAFYINEKIYLFVLVHNKYNFKRKCGSYIKFDENSGILLNSQKQFIGNRVEGPYSYEFYKNNLIKNLLTIKKFV